MSAHPTCPQWGGRLYSADFRASPPSFFLINLTVDDLTRQLSEQFGFAKFRPGQEEIIRAVLAGRDAMTIMPTGQGKSLCYQLPAILLPGLTLVISPLIALMQDQVASLRQRNINAAAFHSGLTGTEKSRVIQDLSVSGSFSCSIWRLNGCSMRGFSTFYAPSGSRCWWSTKRTAFPSGATISDPIISKLDAFARNSPILPAWL